MRLARIARSTMSKQKDIIRRLRGGERSPVNLGALSEILASMEARLPAAPPEVTTTIDVAALERWILHWYGGEWEMAADKIAIKDAKPKGLVACATCLQDKPRGGWPAACPHDRREF
jgi:hypothetical protein